MFVDKGPPATIMCIYAEFSELNERNMEKKKWLNGSKISRVPPKEILCGIVTKLT